MYRVQERSLPLIRSVYLSKTEVAATQAEVAWQCNRDTEESINHPDVTIDRYDKQLFGQYRRECS